MNLINKVKASFKWKKSDQYCATRLGISATYYRDIKKQILDEIRYFDSDASDNAPKDKIIDFKEDLTNGTAQIKAILTTEPKTPEEIIELLKIDTTKWKLANYWNKERNDGWLVSAFVTSVYKESKDVLAEVLETITPVYEAITDIRFINEKFESESVGVISIQDLHFGKENNEDIVEHFKAAVTNLVHRAYMSHKLLKIIYVIGGDLLNMDTFNGATTSGTPVENHQKAQEAYTSAFDALFWSVNYLKQFCDNLHVVYLPGNHDRLSSYHLAHALSKCFDPEDYSVYFDVEYAERKVVVYGHNFFAFEHGDVTKKNTALVYATEFPLCWGKTKYRTCYTGHYHSKKTTEFVTENEYNGFAIKHLPSLCSMDYWHYHNKFTGAKRQAIMEVHDFEKGKVSEFIYTV